MDAVRERDGLEPRVDAKGPKDAANVVPDRLQADPDREVLFVAIHSFIVAPHSRAARILRASGMDASFSTICIIIVHSAAAMASDTKVDNLVEGACAFDW